MIEVCSLNFKALECPWVVSFKRYFLVCFVENLAIFMGVVLVQEEIILIHLQLFPFLVSSILIIFMNNFSARVREMYVTLVAMDARLCCYLCRDGMSGRT